MSVIPAGQKRGAHGWAFALATYKVYGKCQESMEKPTAWVICRSCAIGGEIAETISDALRQKLSAQHNPFSRHFGALPGESEVTWPARLSLREPG